MGIKGTTWNKIISALKVLANFSAWSKANLATSEPSNGTKIFLYIPHLPLAFLTIYINFTSARQLEIEAIGNFYEMGNILLKIPI
jgi:hypothetical protein